jgi:hypothetical protein
MVDLQACVFRNFDGAATTDTVFEGVGLIDLERTTGAVFSVGAVL